MNQTLPKPSPCLSIAAQCREIGIKVGDTIEGRETYPNGGWEDAQLTLLWLGEEIAVWRALQRSDLKMDWSDFGEDADWTLECREWRKV